MKTFISGRLRGGKYAIQGALTLLRTEPSIQVQVTIAIIMTGIGWYVNISNTEWMFQIFAIGLIITAEGLNTAVEGIADFVHPDFHKKIGFIKDVAAGAVFFAAITAVVIGCVIYVPYIF